jgi:hypothetical protein
MIGLQGGQAFFDGGADRVGAAIDAALVTIEFNAAFRSQHVLGTPPLQRLADQGLIGAQPVEPGGIEMRIAQIKRPVQHASTVFRCRRHAIGVR